MIKLHRLFFLLVIFITISNCHKHSDKPMVLLISFDGFRWDYLLKHNLSNFNSIKKNGTHAEYIKNAFSTVTFPNHWTLVTGHYEESHGITQNIMFDPVLNKTFNYSHRDVFTIEWFGQNKLVEPIWTTNQKAGGGRQSAAEWLGSNIVFNDQKIVSIDYNHTKPNRQLIDEFISLFTAETNPINFGAMYFDEPGLILSAKNKIKIFK